MNKKIKNKNKKNKKNKKIHKQIEKVAEAKETQAVQEACAPDWIDRKGVRFYKPNLAAIWFYNRLKVSVNGFASLADFGACLVYACSLNQEGIRNIAMPAITSKTIEVLTFDFFIENKIDQDDVNAILEAIWNPVLYKDKDDVSEDVDEKKPQDSNPSGGAK